jgi:hypothetical protein
MQKHNESAPPAKVDVAMLKSKIDLIDRVRRHGVELHQRGSEFVGLCPFHDDTTPSFSVSQDKQVYHCFGCGASGDVIRFEQETFGVSFPEALRRLNAPMSDPSANVISNEDSPPLKQIPQIPEREPIVDNRDSRLSQTETSATAQPDGCTLSAYAEARRIPEDFLTSLGLADASFPRGTGRSAVKIPYFDKTGEELATQYRIATQKPDIGTTYLWPKKSKTCLYGLWRDTVAEKSIILVEGTSDCHTLWHCGYNAVGVPGASNLNDDRDAGFLESYGRIDVVVEPGSSGETLIGRIALSRIRCRVHLVSLEGFKDPSEMFMDDPESFRARFDAALKGAVPWNEHKRAIDDEALAVAWDSCHGLANHPDILGHITRLIEDSGAVGEQRVIKLLILALTSRVLDRPVSVVVKGTSSSGKSYLSEKVLAAFPAESYTMLTGMSERALAYSEEPLSHRFLVIVEAGGAAGEMASYFLRSLLSEGRISYEMVDKTSEGMRSRRIEREGPTGLLITTTRTGLHPENETRMLSLTVSDTREQTRRVMRSLAVGHQSVDFTEVHALQNWISRSDSRVQIPFAENLAEQVIPIGVRLRRDFSAVLNLIRAHAILHQANRERDAEGRILATLDDYATVRDLVADLVAEGVEATVDQVVRETVDTIDEHGHPDGVTAKEVGAWLNIDRAPALRRCKRATNLGFLKNLEDKRGRPGRYVVGDKMPEDVEILPSPESLNGCAVAQVQPGPGIYDQEGVMAASDRHEVEGIALDEGDLRVVRVG